VTFLIDQGGVDGACQGGSAHPDELHRARARGAHITPGQLPGAALSRGQEQRCAPGVAARSRQPRAAVAARNTAQVLPTIARTCGRE
jgi:hypothetical protein